MNNTKINKAKNKVNYFITRLKQFWILLIAMMIAFGAIGGGICAIKYTPEYTITQAFTIELTNNPNANNATINENQLSKTIPSILNSKPYTDHMAPFIRQAKTSGRFMIKSLSNTNIFYITVTARSNENAIKIIELIEAHYHDLTDKIIGESEMKYFGEPVTSSIPSNSPNYIYGILGGMAIAMALFVAILTIQSITTSTFIDSHEAEIALNSSCLAVINEIKIKRRSGEKRNQSKMPLITDDSATLELKQCINTLASKLITKCEKNGYKVIMSTSSMAGEGKTSVSTNLACSLAEIGHKVLIIDCDLRSPNVFFQLNFDDIGNPLSTAISNGNAVGCITSTGIDNLYLLGNSDGSDNAFYDASGNELKQIISDLRDEYDYIILDTPPIGFLGDGISISESADGFIFVVSYNYVSTNYARHSLDSMNDSNAEMLGFVINHKR